MSEPSFFKDLLHSYFIQIRDHHYAGMDSCGDCTRVENDVRWALDIPVREKSDAIEGLDEQVAALERAANSIWGIMEFRQKIQPLKEELAKLRLKR